MYVIQTDRKSWVKGIWRGWLITCNSPTQALIYGNFSRAEQAVEYYSKIAPGFEFVVEPLP